MFRQTSTIRDIHHFSWYFSGFQTPTTKLFFENQEIIVLLKLLFPKKRQRVSTNRYKIKIKIKPKIKRARQRTRKIPKLSFRTKNNASGCTCNRQKHGISSWIKRNVMCAIPDILSLPLLSVNWQRLRKGGKPGVGMSRWVDYSILNPFFPDTLQSGKLINNQQPTSNSSRFK